MKEHEKKKKKQKTKHEQSLASMLQMVLEISHFKVRNLSKMDVAIFRFLASFSLNPITSGILRFHKQRGGEGGGLFGLDPENKVTVNGLI